MEFSVLPQSMRLAVKMANKALPSKEQKKRMKFRATSRPITDALGKPLSVVPTKTTLAQLEAVRLSVKDNILTLSGTDLEITLETRTEVTGVTNGETFVQGKLLFDVLKALPPQQVTFALDAKKGRLTVSTNTGSYVLPCVPNGLDVKVHDDFDPSISFILKGDVLKSLIERTRFAVSEDDLRPAMGGMEMLFSSEALRLACTDGHRLSQIFLESLGDIELSAIVPDKALGVILKSFADSDDVTIELSDRHAQFSTETTRIRTRLIDEGYPNIAAVIPTDNDKHVRVDREELLACTKRLLLFTNRSVGTIRLTFDNLKLHVIAENPDSGVQGTEFIPCDYSGKEEFSIGFNATYLIEALAHFPQAELIIKLGTPTRAAILIPSEQGSDTHLMLVMPVLLQQADHDSMACLKIK
jgi:DNA polymerase-3 subunit beta